MTIRQFCIKCNTLTTRQLEDMFNLLKGVEGITLKEVPLLLAEGGRWNSEYRYFKHSKWRYVGIDSDGCTKFFNNKDVMFYSGYRGVIITYDKLRGHLGLAEVEENKVKIKPFYIRCCTLATWKFEGMFRLLRRVEDITLTHVPSFLTDDGTLVGEYEDCDHLDWYYVGVDSYGCTKFFDDPECFGEGGVEINYDQLRSHLGLPEDKGASPEPIYFDCSHLTDEEREILCEDFHGQLLKPPPVEVSVESLVVDEGIGINTYRDGTGTKYQIKLPILAEPITARSKKELISVIEFYKTYLNCG